MIVCTSYLQGPGGHIFQTTMAFKIIVQNLLFSLLITEPRHSTKEKEKVLAKDVAQILPAITISGFC